MKIVHIVPGSGGTFYCENCMRDSTLVKALRRREHDVLMVPMYLPLFVDDPEVARELPVFFGGINVYLQQKLAMFRKTPRWFDRMLDSKWLLHLAARKAESTRASGLGAMTLSMIHGEDGHQAKELERLVAWLAESGKPDVVHLSNVLLIGLAHRIHTEIGVPVVCTLQDEDVWLDAMRDEERDVCMAAIRERLGDVSKFVAVSRYYGDRMQRRLQIPPEKMRVIHIGTDSEGHEAASLQFDPPAIGFLSRLSESQGLGVLADAFCVLKGKERYRRLQLHVTGGLTADNEDFVAALKSKLSNQGVLTDVLFYDDFDRAARMKFLAGLSVLSVPVPGGEAFGTFIIEAMASGVPVVQPRAGAFPELIELDGGGVLYEEGNLQSLVTALDSLLDNPERAREVGRQGRRSFEKNFTIDCMARKMAELYDEVRQ